MNLPSKFKFLAFSSGIGGFILFIYGVSTLPQPNTSYYIDDSTNSINGNSDQTRESVNQQNQQAITTSMAFKEMLAGLGVCLLTFVAVILYHRREARIEAITLEEEHRQQIKEEQKKKHAFIVINAPTPAPTPAPAPLPAWSDRRKSHARSATDVRPPRCGH